MAEQKKKALDLTGAKIFFLALIGMGLGAVISWILYDKALNTSLINMKHNVDSAWHETLLRLNKVVDRAIILRKKYVDDKVKADYAMFDNVIDTRSRLLGTEDETEKAALIAQVEEEFDTIIKFYNSRMDLRNKRFTYIQWALETEPLIAEYKEYMEKYRKEVDNFDIQIKRFPLNWLAKRNKFSAYPLPEEPEFTPFENRTEKYIPSDLDDYRVMDKVIKEKKKPEQETEGAAAAEGE